MDAIAAMANANLRIREDDASARAISTSILRHFHAASAEADAADSDVVVVEDDDDVKLLDDKLRTISLIVPIENQFELVWFLCLPGLLLRIIFLRLDRGCSIFCLVVLLMNGGEGSREEAKQYSLFPSRPSQQKATPSRTCGQYSLH